MTILIPPKAKSTGQGSISPPRELNEGLKRYSGWAKLIGMPTNEEQIKLLQYGLESGAKKFGIQEDAAETQTNAFDRDEIIAAAYQDMNILAALSMPTVYEYPFSPTHQTSWQLLINMEKDLSNKFPQIALGIPRAHAKTTEIKLFVLFCILYTKRKFILVCASIHERAMDIISDIADMLDENNIKAVYGDWRLGMEVDRRELKKFGFRGRNISLIALGSEGSLRGLNIKNARPDMMIFDDIQTKENSESATLAKTLEEWMVGTAMKAKSPSGCMFIYAGNMFPTQHSILRKLKSNPTWIKFISGAILADGTALWPESRSIESLLQELDNDIAMGQAHTFFAEVLNDVEVGINSNIDYSKFPDWLWGPAELPQGKFIFIDPSQGKGQDCDVLLLCEVYDEKIGVREVVEEHYSPSNLIRKALIMALENDVPCIIVEAVGYQFTLLHWFEMLSQQLKLSGIKFGPLNLTTTSKNSRISAGLKAMQTRDIILHQDVKPIVQRQIADWNPMKRDNKDDIIDAISSVQKVVEMYRYDIMCRTNWEVIESSAATVDEANHIF